MPIIITGSLTTPAPTLLSVVPFDGAAQVTWSALSSTDVTGYTVTAALANGTPVRSVTSSPSSRTVLISPLANDVTYSFSVVANSGTGGSPSSNALTATPTGGNTDPTPEPPAPLPPAAGQPTLSAFPADRAFTPDYWLLTTEEADAL